MTQAFLYLGDGGHSFLGGAEPLWGQVSHHGHWLESRPRLKVVWRGNMTFPRAWGLENSWSTASRSPRTSLCGQKAGLPRADLEEDIGTLRRGSPGSALPWASAHPGVTASAFPSETPRAGPLPAGPRVPAPNQPFRKHSVQKKLLPVTIYHRKLRVPFNHF